MSDLERIFEILSHYNEEHQMISPCQIKACLEKMPHRVQWLVMKMATVMQRGCQKTEPYIETLRTWKHDPDLFFYAAPDLITALQLKCDHSNKLPTYQIIHQRLLFCSFHRLVHRKGYYRRGSRSRSVEVAKFLLKNPREEMQLVVKRALDWGSHFDYLSKELGGDGFLFAMPTDKES
jgi:hypothetical protein